MALTNVHATDQIVRVRFGQMSADEIRRRSVVHVTESSLYCRALPRENGLNDLRMGSTDRRMRCTTCKNSAQGARPCVGHPGHIELKAAVFHPVHIPRLCKLLSCVCFFCSRALFPAVEDEVAAAGGGGGKARLAAMSAARKTRRVVCPHDTCKAPQPLIRRSGTGLAAEFADDVEWASEEERAWACAPLTPARVREILHFIPHKTLSQLGFNPVHSHPENFIITVVAVPPPVVRPAIVASDGSRMRGQDDVTMLLLAILKCNAAIERVRTTTGGSDAAACEDLQRVVGTYVHHDTRATSGGVSAGTHNRKMRGFYERWKGKRGRIRGTLQGQRVNKSGRSVVGGQPTLDMDCVCVPEAMALKLTVSVTVNAHNLAELSRRVHVGAKNVTGAKFVTLLDGSQINLELYDAQAQGPLQLQPGCVVERFLQNDDWVVFNRQPSLHKMSMMAHKVRLHKLNTFGLSICATTPYNADFDGDEMNVHVCGLEVGSELAEIMCVSRQIVSPQSNKPIIHLVQDSVVAVFMMTAAAEVFTPAEAAQIIMAIQYLPPDKSLHNRLTGKQIFSSIIPSGVFLDERVRGGDEETESHIVIERGELVRGRLCKRAVILLIHVIYNDCGHEAAGRFISDAQRILVEYLLIRGFSVGIQDCVDAPGAASGVAAAVAATLAHVVQIQATGRGMLAATVESSVSRALQTVITRAGGVVRKCIKPDNAFNIMVESGAKGSPINLAQIMGIVGQQSVEGARIACGLPGFAPGDVSPSARGFVKHNYVQGLSPQEYFAHAMGGREGLADTAVKTASTGYLQRRMVTLMMNLRVAYDGTVRDARDQIVQHTYGGDAYDSTTLEKKQLPILNMSNTDMRNWVSGADTSCFQELATLRNTLRDAWLVAGAELQNTVYMPFDVVRALKRAQAHALGCAVSPALARDVEDALRMLCADMETTLGPLPSLVTRAYVRCWLTPRLITDMRITRAELDHAVAEIQGKFHRAIVQPGEMVGAVAATSIGEPLTQMTLNTFHYAGVGSKNVTLGVPRMKECIDVSRNIKTPSLTVRFARGLCKSEAHARLLANALECLPMVRVVASSSVELEPDVWRTRFESDAHPLRLAAALHGQEDVSRYGKYVARFVLNQAALMQRNLTVAHVGDAVRKVMGSDAQVVRSEPCMQEWVVRVRMTDIQMLLQDAIEENDEDAAARSTLQALERVFLQEIHDYLLDVQVQGVPGIRRVSLRKERVSAVVEDQRIESSEVWVADTQGTNLEAVMELPGVDPLLTSSNDIHEVLDIFGIEVAARILADEINLVLGFDGTYVNKRHVSLLVDAMTSAGVLMPVTRHGMNTLGVFARMSFEEMHDVVNQAAAFGEEDSLRGVTESVLIGKLAPVGTGIVSVKTKPGYTWKPPTQQPKQQQPRHPDAPRPIIAPLLRDVVKERKADDTDNKKKSFIKPLQRSSSSTTTTSTPAETTPQWVGRKRTRNAPPAPPAATKWTFTPKSPSISHRWSFVPKSPS